jgi:catechol 2,3-dioxygenase-like lactoylglutathione lyase family enzyme
MQQPPMRFSGPVLGSPDPLALAEFYSRLLGWPITDRETGATGDPADGWAMIRSPSVRLKLEFQYEPYFVPPVWPPVEGEQQLLIHLDVGVPDLEAGVAWAVEAGATVAAHQPQEDVRVLRDPSGHIFCLFTDEL